MYNSDEYKEYQSQSGIFGGRGKPLKYWVFVMQKGRWVNIGAEDNEAAAEERANVECPEYHHEIRGYNTSDTSEANRRWKYDQLKTTHDLNLSTQRMIRKAQPKPTEVNEIETPDDEEDNWASLGGFKE